MIAAGTCSIRATQAGNGQYAAATPVPQSFSVTAVTTADFTIRPIPSVQNLVLGNITAFALELKSVQKFNGNVTLSCSGGPAGSKCANLPQTVRVNGTALAVSGNPVPEGHREGHLHDDVYRCLRFAEALRHCSICGEVTGVHPQDRAHRSCGVLGLVLLATRTGSRRVAVLFSEDPL